MTKNMYALEIQAAEDHAVEDHRATAAEINDEVHADGITKNQDENRVLVQNKADIYTQDWTHGMWGTAASLGYFLIASTILTFFMNFVHARMPQGVPPLPDIGHDLVPKLEPENLGDTPMAIMLVIMLISVALNSNRWPILSRFLLALGNLYLIRVVSIYVTSLPPTDNHCRTEYKPIDNIYWNTFLGLVTFGSKNRHCGDLMFSGHTCFITNIWMAIMTNFKGRHPLRIILRVIESLLLLTTCYLIIATRSHYTGDIWIAFWLTALMHALTPYAYPYTAKKMGAFFKRVL